MPSPLKKGSPDGQSTRDKSPLLTGSRTSPEEDQGHDNPVFDLDRDETVSRLGSMTPVPPNSRRGSAVVSMSSLLTVPKSGKNNYY